ncbi:MmcQ/YjbR family DNA-binding protein [Mucilaginibacter sp. ZT4R22]|uniref:MmcQ/YjbR family DNA-binding protein n=1 Tax=Mucilaginibacter pankratovii TaxID=2772110 RepID=A0ABR7WZ04_9SPHI|nr:MmcQ/YjbR family DNA-binding protein [Mucilaginibacter pankratovii]MBD1367521.1 MmcQ/YjbR family DNA-binding protein [Mucilaginibacter pankratovii]
MNIEELRDYCLALPAVEEGFPFGEDTLVFKVGGKIFLLAGLQDGHHFNAKCDPELAIDLRERYTEVKPGYHMNKAHWNTVYMNGTLTRKQLCEMIDHSYHLVFKSLPKKLQAEISPAK